MLFANEHGHVGVGKLYGEEMKYRHEIQRYLREFTLLLKSIWKQRNGVEKEILYVNYIRKQSYQRKWFYDFLTHHKLLIPGKRFQLVLFSVMGRRWMTKLPFGRPKVFFTAENTTGRHINYDDYLDDTVDLSLGFKPTCTTKNRLNFPLWILYNIAPSNSRSESTKNKVYSAEAFIRVLEQIPDFEHRPYDMALICRHDNIGNGKGNRGQALDMFQQAGFKVLSAGRFRKNTTILDDEFSNDHLRLLQQCKFYICMENTDAPGYTTEKLFDALKSGAIPIYWGSEGRPARDVLTGNGIVFYDPSYPQKCLSIVKKITSDVTFRQEFLSKPKTHPQASQIISNCMELLSAGRMEMTSMPMLAQEKIKQLKYCTFR